MANNAANNSDRWYFTKEQLENTPSREAGVDQIKELLYRQQTANLIQDMGQRLKVSQLCINTAIVYMHRFYVFHSFTNFPWYQMAAAALFLAAKIEEQPRKLEYVIRVANSCRTGKDQHIDVNSERYIAQSQDLVFNENVLLQTLGFDVAIDHPHTHVVRCCQLVKASIDLAQRSYFLANCSLHLTPMCLQYKPTVVACFCIHLACKWSSWEIPLSSEKKEWFLYVDTSVTADLLRQLTTEFLAIHETCPSKLREKIMAIGDNSTNAIVNSPLDANPKKSGEQQQKDSHSHRSHEKGSEDHKHRRPHESSSSSSMSQQQRERENREKKDREKLAQQQHGLKPPSSSSSSSQSKPSSSSSSSSHHHRPPVDAKLKIPWSSSRPSSSSFSGGVTSSSGSFPSSTHRSAEPRDILREAARDSPFGIATKDCNRESSHSSEKKDQVRGNSSNSNSDKDKLTNRDYLLKPNVIESSSGNSLNNYDSRLNYSGSRSSVDPNKVPSSIKQESSRRHDDNSKSYLKTEPDGKKHYVHDKSSTYNVKSSASNSTSQKIKSPFTTDPSKSVPKNISTITASATNKHQYNGSSGGSNYSLPLLDIRAEIKEEAPDEQSVPNTISSSFSSISLNNSVAASITTNNPNPATITATATTRMPSLFSPEKSPVSKKPNYPMKLSPDSRKADSILSPLTSPTTISPASAAVAVPSTTASTATKRSRNYSSSSEPELRPVMKKIDQVEGFENLMRDSTIGINKLHQVPDIITPIPDKEIPKETKLSYSKDMKPPDLIPPLVNDVPPPLLQPSHLSTSLVTTAAATTQPIVNGMETNPMLISSLLKEAPPIPHLPVVANINETTKQPEQPQQIIQQQPQQQQLVEPAVIKEKEKEHHHHKKKKKNKEKHKHKDKDRSKEEKEKKKKHKDKDREKHKHSKHESSSSAASAGAPPQPAEPIKIKIQKDKIHSLPEPGTLKIKIPKDVIKTDTLMSSQLNNSVGSSHHSHHHYSSSSHQHHSQQSQQSHHHQQQQQQQVTSTNIGGGIKIKIPREVINCNSDNTSGSSSSSRKRDRSSPGDLPQQKMSRSHRESSSKQNGRHSYSKVTQQGDGDTSIHRLAESKYMNKNSSS